jgi:pyridoxal phosphate enzyme (YggS family)
MGEIGAALDMVRRRIERACERAHRAPGDVRLVAISKTVGVGRIRELIEHGHSLLGENQVQEALPKVRELGAGVSWHFVGHMQRNKVRQAVGVFELIHSLDSLRLAREMNRRAADAGLRQAVLVQVNLAGEETKHGVGEAELPALLESIASLERVEPRGLMTIPPQAADPEQSRSWFARLRELRDRATGWSGQPLPELSMGMTDDFEVAVEEGATLVRVGRAIFGERPAP